MPLLRAKARLREDQFRRSVCRFTQRLHGHVNLEITARIRSRFVSARLGPHDGVRQRLAGVFIHHETDEHRLILSMQRGDALRQEFARRLDGIELENDVVRILRQHDEFARHRLITRRGDFDRVLSLIQRQRGVTVAFDTVAPDARRLLILATRSRLYKLRLHRITRRTVHEPDADRLRRVLLVGAFGLKRQRSTHSRQREKADHCHTINKLCAIQHGNSDRVRYSMVAA